MEHRIVQVGSRFMFAAFHDGRYIVRTGAGADTTTPETQSGRNPRSLLAKVLEGDLFDSADEAEAAYRDTYDGEPIWDLNDAASPGNEYISLGDASRELGLEPATLRNQIHNRSLSGFKIGRNWVITSDEMERYRRENLGATGKRSTG